MTVKFTNNASTTVATGINTTATSLVVASAAGFPALSGSGDYCYLTIQQAAGTSVEVVKATALSSNTFTIVRAQDGTSAGSWSVSDAVELRVTAALLTDIVDAATHDSSVLSVDSTNNRVGVNDTTPSVTLDISGTDAIALPVGTTAQRPAAGAGRFRYNSSLSQFEGYTDAWGAIGGGGTNTFTTDTFTANGSLVAFNLSQTVSSENNLLVFIDGVFQTQDAYAIATASGTTTLTFSAAPANARKIVVYSVAAGISGANLNIDSMTGDGSDTTLTLTVAPVTEQNTQVFIDGVYQSKSNYSVSGTTLTFSTAPPTGSAVEVMTFTQTEINVPVDNTITSAKLSGALVTPSDLTVTGALLVDTDTLVVDATNNRVGIGTSSPATILNTKGATLTTATDKREILLEAYDDGATNSLGALTGVTFRNSPTTYTAGSFNRTSGIYGINLDSAGYGRSMGLALYTSSVDGTATEKMRIDGATGNVGIGVAPSAWSSAFGSVMQLKSGSGGGALSGSGTDNFRMFANTYYDGAYKKIGTGFSTMYEQASGSHIWFSNASSAANATFTPIPRMFLSANGGLGLGTNDTTDAAWGSAANNTEFAMDGNGGYGVIHLRGTGGGSTDTRYSIGCGDSKFYLAYDDITGVHRITAYENQVEIKNNSTAYAIKITTAHGFAEIGALNSTYLHNDTDRTYNYWSKPCQASGGFATYSDERLKENITPIDSALSKVEQMNGVTFTWIDPARGGGNTGKQFGVIAQNMAAIDSELPSILPDPLETDENINDASKDTDYYTMDYSRITPFLIEAIKELKEELNTATARITELENN